MTRTWDAIRDILDEEEDGEDVMDYISEGEGEPLDSLEAPVQINQSFPKTIVVVNVPKVGADKLPKLTGVLSKVMDSYGPNEKHIPLDPSTNMTQGIVIATFESEDAASSACSRLNGFSLDRNHTFKVLPLDEFDNIVNRSDVFQYSKKLSTFTRTDFRTWLMDEKCREQILLRYKDETEIYWHDTLAGAPVLCYGGEREKQDGKVWCSWRVQWSPLGSYLATHHAQGIALWGGSDFTKKGRFEHKGVRHVDFSPTEDYMLTWNGALPTDADETAVKIFRVLTGECVFQKRTPAMTPGGNDFPHFLWSHDGKFFAECNENAIAVRDTDTFELIKDEEGKKRSIKFECLETFQWSPKDNIIAVWTKEKDNNPARLHLWEIPSRRELASRSRTQVEASMYWQSEGDYLCLLNTKLSKTKKKGATNLEIFRIRERNIPVDVVEVKDVVKGFFWETKGSRFAVLTADELGHHPKLLVYALGKEKCENVVSFDLPSGQYNNVYWAPEGQYFVAAGIGSGEILFGSITPENKLELTFKDDHFMLTDVQWDPSSRYVITAVTQPMQEAGAFRFSMEAGYAIWTFQGRCLYRQQKEKLWQIAWRPHPPSLLSAPKQREIRKNIKNIGKKYDQADEQEKMKVIWSLKKEREDKNRDFNKVVDRLMGFQKRHMEEIGWDEAQDRFNTAMAWEENVETVEEIISKVEEPVTI